MDWTTCTIAACVVPKAAALIRVHGVVKYACRRKQVGLFVKQNRRILVRFFDFFGVVVHGIQKPLFRLRNHQVRGGKGSIRKGIDELRMGRGVDDLSAKQSCFVVNHAVGITHALIGIVLENP